MEQPKLIELTAGAVQAQVHDSGAATLEIVVDQSRLSIEIAPKMFRSMVYQIAHELERVSKGKRDKATSSAEP